MTLPYSRLQEINSYQKFLLAFKAATQCSDAGTGGATGLPPQYLADQLKPYSNRGGQIIPTYYYWHPQCFSPSVITACTQYWLCLQPFSRHEI